MVCIHSVSHLARKQNRSTFCLRLRCSSPASLSWMLEELLNSLSETEAACSCRQHMHS